jgi:tRNA nucleotidyltransferase (CCA-adding enzyme)
MAYNSGRGLVDAFCGIQDLEKGVIRCVGNPGARFDEDALRMLRAVRFSGQLGFAIEEKTRQAIEERAEHLQNISAERIRVELTKLLTAKDSGQIREAYHTGMTKIFLPELDRMMETAQKNPHHIYTVGEHAIHSVEVMNFFLGRTTDKWDAALVPQKAQKLACELAAGLTPKEQTMLCIAMLLHDVGKPDTMTVDEKGIGHFYGHQQVSEQMAGGILKRLTFDNETISVVKRLIRWHDYQYGEKPKAMRKAAAKIGKDIMPLLFLVQMSDVLSQNPVTFVEKLDRIYHAQKLWKDVLSSEAALEVKDLQISGRDLIAAGVKAGPDIGRMLQEALEYVLEEPERNRKEELLDWLLKDG